jgi:DeoR/GlpR family transcriptional regulator of sugar metabolism
MGVNGWIAARPSRPSKYDQPMFAVERRRLIVDRVRELGFASLGELAAVTGSSEATIRRDLRTLADIGLISRSRGGAALREQQATPADLGHVAAVAGDEQVIADLASTLIYDGDALVLGAGRIAQSLARRVRDRRNLMVVTNSILVGQELAAAEAIEVVMTGGSLRPAVYALDGSEAEHALVGVRVRRAFLVGGGLTATRGLSTSGMSAASVDRALADAADEVVALAAAAVVGVDAMFQTVPPERLSYVVTAAAADQSVVDQLTALGVRVLVGRA